MMAMPANLLCLRTGLRTAEELEPFRDKYSWWQGTIKDGSLWLIGDPAELPKPLLEKCSATPDRIPLTYERAMQCWDIFSELTNRAIEKVLRESHSLRTWTRGRFFFEKPAHSDERKIKYKSRKRMSSITVVKKEFERGPAGETIRYFRHEAIRARVVRFRGKPRTPALTDAPLHD
jgi:hypothetical protein